MTRAADILRERAARNEQHIKFAEQSPRQATREKASRYRREIAEWRAVADLLDACIDDDGHGLTCVICGGWRYGSATAEHLPGCKRAAAERVIARERE